MLQLVLIALLVVSSACFPKYNIYSSSEFEDHSPDITFPSFRVLDKNLAYGFKVTNTLNGLAFLNEDFKEEKGNFAFKKEKIGISSLEFEFNGEDSCRLLLTFKSKFTGKEWTVNSIVFTPPTEEPLITDATTKAVNAEHHLTNEVADQLLGQCLFSPESPCNRLVCMYMPWVVLLIQGNPPRFYGNPESTSSEKWYSGLPVLIDEDVLKKLTKVREQLEIIH